MQQYKQYIDAILWKAYQWLTDYFLRQVDHAPVSMADKIATKSNTVRNFNELRGITAQIGGGGRNPKDPPRT